MRRTVFGLLVAVPTLAQITPVFAATDFRCVNDCARQGYMYQYCVEHCSYTPTPPPARVDYRCVNNCTARGYIYSYCVQACFY